MSQITKLFDGSAKKDVETLTGNSGGPVGVDAAFNINILGSTGISVVGTPLTNTLTISQSDMLTGTGQTIGAVTADLITVPLGAVPGTYTFDVKVAGFEPTTPLGAGYEIIASARTTGAAAVLVPNQAIDEMEEGALIAGAAYLTVAGNNAIIRVLGTAALTIRWKAVAEYVFVS